MKLLKRSSANSPTVARSYDAQAQNYMRRWSTYVARSTELTLAALPAMPAGARILDVGCGTGELLATLSEKRKDLSLYGVDVSAGMLELAQGRLEDGASLQNASVEHLPFGDGAFEAVVTASSLHHWRKPDRGLAEISRVLAADGVLVVTDWCRETLRMRVMDGYLRLRDPAHARSFTTNELATLIRGAGFRIGSHERHHISMLWDLQVVTARRN